MLLKVSTLVRNSALAFSLLQGASAFAGGGTCQDLFRSETGLTIEQVRSEFERTPDDKDNGLVTDKVPINVQSLTEAYNRGHFPWDLTPEGNGVWFNPPKRGILELSEVRIGKSDLKALRQLEAQVERGELRVTFDTAFERVMRECQAQSRMRRNPKTGLLEDEGTWISEPIMKAYTDMFKAGRAHSVEIWKGDELVAGSYGTAIGGVFSGESMFHKMPDVAKLAFLRMIEKTRSLGYTWLDTQVAPPDSTSLTVKWGAREITRDEYLDRVREANKNPIVWPK